jgi:hypothetical protein
MVVQWEYVSPVCVSVLSAGRGVTPGFRGPPCRARFVRFHGTVMEVVQGPPEPRIDCNDTSRQYSIITVLSLSRID